MNGMGYMGAARNRQRAAKAATARPMNKWKTGRVERFLASGKATATQAARAERILERRGASVQTGGGPNPDPNAGNNSGTNTGNNSGNNSGTNTGGGTTFDNTGWTNTGGGGGWAAGDDWSGGGDSWSDLYGSGGGAARQTVPGGPGADAAPGAAGGGISPRTWLVLAAVGFGAWMIWKRKGGRK